MKVLVHEDFSHRHGFSDLSKPCFLPCRSWPDFVRSLPAGGCLQSGTLFKMKASLGSSAGHDETADSAGGGKAPQHYLRLLLAEASSVMSCFS